MSHGPDLSLKALPAPRKIVPEMDSRDRLLLPLAWLLGVLLVQLLSGVASYGLPGLGISLCMWACYGVLFWYAGLRQAFRRGNRLLLVCEALLSLSFLLFSDQQLRLLNCLAVCLLASVQLFQQTGLARCAWTRCAVVGESISLTLQGLFGRLDRPFRALGSCGGKKNRQLLTVAVALLVAVPLLAVILPLLLSADAVFEHLLSGMVDTLRLRFGTVLSRMVLGAVLGLFLYSLLYFLRHGREGEEPPARAAAALRCEALGPAVVLGLLDALYLLFLGVQSAVLFGGTRYLSSAGVSYAQYARSGFFQLVAVAAINLSVLLLCLRLTRPGKGRRAVQVLSTLLVGESAVLLISAAWRMSLYVGAYGLSRLRFTTYWGILLLAVFLAAAVWKIWRPGFGFFRVLFTVCLVGWVALCFCGMDGLIARYNVSRYQAGELESLDLRYLTSLSEGALWALEDLPGDTVVDTVVQENRDGTMTLRERDLDEVLSLRRARAGETASRWESWDLTSALRAGSGGA